MRIYPIFYLALLLLLVLVSCGQKGELYLPDRQGSALARTFACSDCSLDGINRYRLPYGEVGMLGLRRVGTPGFTVLYPGYLPAGTVVST